MCNTKNLFMKKKISLVFAVLLLVAVVFAPLQGFAADGTISANGVPKKITIHVNGGEKTYEPAAVNVNGSIMVPIRAIAEDLGAIVNWDGKTKEIKIVKGNRRSSIKIGSYTGFVGSEVATLPQKPFIAEGHALVPLRFVAESLDMRVTWDAATKSVHITAKSEFAVTEGAVTSGSITPTVLTYAEAMRKGVPKSTQYTNASFSAEKAEISNEELALPTGKYVNDLITAKNDLQMMDKWGKMNLVITKEQVEFALRTQMDNLSMLLAEKEVLGKKTEAMEYAHHISGLKYQSGLISKNDFATSEYNLNTQKAKVVTLDKEIEGAYVALNTALGYPTSARYEIEFKNTYLPIEDKDIEYRIATGLASDPYIWLSKESEASSKLKLTLYEYNLEAKSWSLTNLDVQQATKDLHNLEKSYGSELKERLNKLEQMETKIESLKLTIAQTEDQVNLLRLKYDQGMVIQSDLTTAIVGLSELAFDLKQLEVQHSQLKSTYTTPYLNPTYTT